MAQPQIHVLLDDPIVPTTIVAALRRMDAKVRLSRLDNEVRNPSRFLADARLVVTSRNSDGPDERVRLLGQHYQMQPCATLVLTPSPHQIPDDNALANWGLPMGFASGLSLDELVGRLSAMCSMQRPLSTLRHQLDQLRQQGPAAELPVDTLSEQMRLAAQIQRDLLPDPLPKLRSAKLRTRSLTGG